LDGIIDEFGFSLATISKDLFFKPLLTTFYTKMWLVPKNVSIVLNCFDLGKMTKALI
jgi:hypothetical protein